jgi:hypothetical protein
MAEGQKLACHPYTDDGRYDTLGKEMIGYSAEQ